MPFDTGAITGILRELYGPGIEQILYPENNAGPLHRIARNQQEGVFYPIPLIYGIIDEMEQATGITTLNLGQEPGSYGYMKASKEFSPIVHATEWTPIKFDEEWVDA